MPFAKKVKIVPNFYFLGERQKDLSPFLFIYLFMDEWQSSVDCGSLLRSWM